MIEVLLVGGGTAGHVLPAIATAQTLERMRPGIALAFAGLEGSLEERLVEKAGYAFHAIDAVPLPRRPTTDLLRVMPQLFSAVRRARGLLADTGAQVVVSFGGYVALPLSLAARGRVPLVLHEQNSRPGLANRIASRFASRVAVTFPSSSVRLGRPDLVRITGNPVQQHIRDLDVISSRAMARDRLGLAGSCPTLLVLGGSQGARSINQAVSGAVDAWRSLGLQVLHITGPRGHDETLGWWKERGVDPEAADASVRVVPYLDDMVDAYAAADVVVSRAGATTIAELTVLGLPAVLVPYPHATAQHQHGNAEALVRAGAALALDDQDLSPDAIATAVASILAEPGRAASMARAARAWSRPEAAEGLARIVLGAIGGRDE
jgi:UDP-N-acetylglucosamine--N-acetylmuramyl-(pentapeptide) pyrophosphoryl-undecaprenol N-acetylglucosamine transferase